MVPNGQAVNNAISRCHDATAVLCEKHPRMHLRLLHSLCLCDGSHTFLGLNFSA